MTEDLAQKVFTTLEKKDSFELAQIRFVTSREEYIRYRNGLPYNISMNEGSGVGIRVRVDNAWGFSATDNFDNITETAEQAYRVAKSSALVKRSKKVDLAPEPVYKDKYSVRIDKNPFDIDFSEKMNLIKEANKRIQQESNVIRFAETYYRCREQKVNFYSSDGNDIEQLLLFTGAMNSAVASSQGETQRRALEDTKTRGWEAIDMYDMLGTAETVAKDAVTLVTKAEKCPSGKKTFILEPFQLGLTIHESCGHPAELDRVLGYEADFAGTSWLTPEKLNKLKYGNEKINITQDPSMEGVLGHFKYDDEGVKTRAVPIIKEGLFVGYESDREHAALLGLNRSSGNSKAGEFYNVPIIRMNNLFLEADPNGYKDIDEMIADTPDGVYGLNWKSHSIDDKRLNFQFATQIGYLIKNGEIIKPLKNVTYQAITPEFWGACSGLTKTSKIYGLPYCGKGSPSMQVGYVSHGGPWGRFDNVSLGVA